MPEAGARRRVLRRSLAVGGLVFAGCVFAGVSSASASTGSDPAAEAGSRQDSAQQDSAQGGSLLGTLTSKAPASSVDPLTTLGSSLPELDRVSGDLVDQTTGLVKASDEVLSADIGTITESLDTASGESEVGSGEQVPVGSDSDQAGTERGAGDGTSSATRTRSATSAPTGRASAVEPESSSEASNAPGELGAEALTGPAHSLVAAAGLPVQAVGEPAVQTISSVVAPALALVEPATQTVREVVAPVVDTTSRVVVPAVASMRPALGLAAPVLRPVLDVAEPATGALEPAAGTFRLPGLIGTEPELAVPGQTLPSSAANDAATSSPAGSVAFPVGSTSTAADHQVSLEPATTLQTTAAGWFGGMPSTSPSPMAGLVGMPVGAPGAAISVDQIGSMGHAWLPEHAVQRARLASAAAHARIIEGRSQREAANPPVFPD